MHKIRQDSFRLIRGYILARFAVDTQYVRVACPYENIQQHFSNSMAEIVTRFLAGFVLLFSYNNSNTSAIISGKIFRLARILMKILFRL